MTVLARYVVGVAFTVTEMAAPALVPPVVLFLTVSVPGYGPAPAPPGTVMPIGLTGSERNVTFVNPAVIAAPLHAMLYWSGDSVVALYLRFAVVVPAHTLGFAPRVIVGFGLVFVFTVTETEMGEPPLVQPVVLFLTVSVAL